MKLAELIRRMAEAGAPAEAIALAVEAVEALQVALEERLAAKRDGNRERQRRHRSRVTERDITRDVTRDERDPSPKKEKSPRTPLKRKKLPHPIPPSEEPDGSSSPKGDEPKKTPREILLGCLSAEVADAVLAHRKALRRPCTVRAAQLLVKGFLATADPNAAADMMIVQGWHGFKPEWFDNERRSNGNGKQGQGQSRRGSISDVAPGFIERIDKLYADREGRPSDSGANGGQAVRLLPAQRGK